jgi:hypothetical protein
MNEDAEMYDPKEAFFDANYKLEDASDYVTLEEVGVLCAEYDTFTKDEQQTFRAALKALLDQVQQLGMSRSSFFSNCTKLRSPSPNWGMAGFFPTTTSRTRSSTRLG